MARLGDVIEQIRGVSYKPSDLKDTLNDNSVILLRANNIQDGKIVLDDVLYVSKSKVNESQYLRRGDILVCTSSGSKELVGKAAFVDENLPAVFGAFCKVVRPKIECCKYVGHFFQSPYYRNYISAASAGANINNLRNEHIADLHIPLPPLEEQRKIAAVLDKVSGLIAKRRQQLDKLDELVKSRFIEMFGDPVDDSCRYQKTPLGAIANVGSSKRKRIFEKEYVNEGVPFYRTKEIVELSKGHKITTELFITKERYDEICKEYGAPQKGDLLISAVGTIGIIWIVDGKNNFYFKDGNLLRVSVSNNFNPIYLKMLLETLISAQKQKISAGTAYAALTISMLKEMMVYIVPMDEQNQFADFVKQTDKSKLAIQKSLEKLEILKKSLMQKYFD